MKKSTYLKKHSNKKESPWDSIEPDSSVGKALNLTRDIAGFFCVLAGNLHKKELIENMMDELLENT